MLLFIVEVLIRVLNKIDDIPGINDQKCSIFVFRICISKLFDTPINGLLSHKSCYIIIHL